MVACDTCKRLCSLFFRRWKAAFPTICFFILLFLFVVFVFGSSYAMAVSPITTLFQIRRSKHNAARDYVKLFLGCVLLCLLAFLAAQSVWLCVVLNLIIPFLLVFLTSSQFAPKAYAGFAMTFVFLELRPPDLPHLPMQLLAVGLCSALLVLALALCAWLTRRGEEAPDQFSAGLNRLAQLLDQLADGGGAATARAEFDEMARRFHRMGYDRRHTLHLPDPQKQACHLFALLFQRAAYLTADDSWQACRDLPDFPHTMHTLARLVRQLPSASDEPARRRLRGEMQTLLESTDLPDSRLRIFYRSVLHMLILLCRKPTPGAQLPLWRRVPWRTVWENFRRRCAPDRFEFRFALRLAVVMTVSCTVSFLWEFEHTYWFPLHAYLLLQPSYEESAQRMLTRPLGTAIGCVLVHLVYPYLPGLPGIFVFSLLMISLMFCCTPGTWVHPIFSTAFALTMATLTVRESQAIQLRLLYLAMAVALVLVVNRFLLPNRKPLQFRWNLNALFSLQGRYWGVIQQSLREPLSPALFSELLSQYHLVYHEASGFLRQLSPAEAAPYRAQLLLLWNMFSELEQVECLIQTRAIPVEQYGALERVAEGLQAPAVPGQTAPAVQIPDELAGSDLSYVLSRYLRNARTLAALS